MLFEAFFSGGVSVGSDAEGVVAEVVGDHINFDFQFLSSFVCSDNWAVFREAGRTANGASGRQLLAAVNRLAALVVVVLVIDRGWEAFSPSAVPVDWFHQDGVAVDGDNHCSQN